MGVYQDCFTLFERFVLLSVSIYFMGDSDGALARLDACLARRDHAGAELATDASAVAGAGKSMAERFQRGGKLLTFGNGAASTDASHLAVEFMHPVIVGKPALPAVALTLDPATMSGVAQRAGFDQVFSHQLNYLADPGDIALGVSQDGECDNVRNGLAAARKLGLLTVGLVGGDGGSIAAGREADHVLIAHDSDPAVVKEIHVTLYHLLWELVHILLDRAPGKAAAAV